VFAGAAREKVFSRPEVIRRVQADFVPVAVSPPSLLRSEDTESRLFQSIYRSRPADQGICVLNARGEPLEWVLMFDDEKSILAFLDHSLTRFRQPRDETLPIVTERHMRFPSARMVDFRYDGQPAPSVGPHASGELCPARPPVPAGAFVAHVVGRALDEHGNLSTDTTSQDRYAQDRFSIPPELQQAVARTISAAGPGWVRLPDELARLCVMHAYLGQIDVRPLANPLGGSSELKECDFWARKEGADVSRWISVQGRSEVVSELAQRDHGGGYRHAVSLVWHGFIERNGARMTRLLLSGQGTEELKWGAHGLAAGRESEVAHLPAGHPIDQMSPVRYGIIAAAAVAGG
jgi:hypothetical protein